MTDIWGFLLQTLTASGAAVLLLIVKAVFRDKLPPRWQFGVWGVLALTLLIPAGWGGTASHARSQVSLTHSSASSLFPNRFCAMEAQ